MKIGLIQEIYIGEECLSPWQLSAMLLQLRRKASCKRIKAEELSDCRLMIRKLFSWAIWRGHGERRR
jgi:phage gp16-like protein